MGIANYFYNSTLRKYVALFGTYFNQMKIQRADNNGTVIQDMIVPISYAPFQKILARVTQDPKFLKGVAINLPRMSFEMTNMSYDPDRKVAPTRKLRKTGVDEEGGGRRFVYSGTPYNLDFSLYIMAKYNEDAVKILEQILPFFNPEFTSTVRLIDGLEPIDIPLILNDTTFEDLYEGDFEERRSVLYTLNFTMKGCSLDQNEIKQLLNLLIFVMHQILLQIPHLKSFILCNQEWQQIMSLQRIEL